MNMSQYNHYTVKEQIKIIRLDLKEIINKILLTLKIIETNLLLVFYKKGIKLKQMEMLNMEKSRWTKSL